MKGDQTQYISGVSGMLWRAWKLLATLTLILSLKKGEGRVRVEGGSGEEFP